MQDDDPYPVDLALEYVGEEASVSPDVRTLFEILVGAARDLGVPPFSLSVVFSGDIDRSVREHGEGSFAAERLRGVVAGKTLPRVRDYSQTDIIINMAVFGSPEAGADILFPISLLMHEYAHALIGRLRAAAGTRLGIPLSRHQTLQEAAPIIISEAADEYRCERFAAELIASALRVLVNGSDMPLSLSWLRSSSVADVGDVLNEVVHPGWPDLVDSYRCAEILLEDLHARLVSETVEILKLLARTDAVQHADGLPSVLTDFADHPAVSLYLRDAWGPVLDVLEGSPAIPTLAEFGEVDRALQACGDGLVEMWARLGVRGELTPEDQLYLHVEEPVR